MTQGRYSSTVPFIT